MTCKPEDTQPIEASYADVYAPDEECEVVSPRLFCIVCGLAAAVAFVLLVVLGIWLR